MDKPGVRARLSRDLEFSSDGHFYYHLNYLKDSGLIEIKDNCISITKEGKDQFEMNMGLKTFGGASLALGITLIMSYFFMKFGYFSLEGILYFALLAIGYGLVAFHRAKKNEPRLPESAKVFLSEIEKS
jgi:hypothetical protein